MEDKDKDKVQEQLERHQDKAIKKQKDRIANDDVEGDD